MAKRKYFAVNFKRLVQERGGLSKLARAIGVNRTQMHRYLKGEALPRPTLLKRFAEYFQISELDLFKPTNDLNSNEISYDLLDHPFAKSIINSMSTNAPITIQSGKYITYFYAPSDDGIVVRGLTFVSRLGGHVVFLRLTGAREPNGSRWRFSRGRNIGVVLESRSNLFFAGFERGQTRQPSLIVMRSVQTGRLLFTGQGVITARAGPTVAAVVMDRLQPEFSLHQALRLCTTIGIRDRGLDPDVRILLQEQLHG
jgi:transcriptional regulator with XRE-family HTH domain